MSENHTTQQQRTQPLPQPPFLYFPQQPQQQQMMKDSEPLLAGDAEQQQTTPHGYPILFPVSNVQPNQQMYGYPSPLPMGPLYTLLPNGQFQMITPQPSGAPMPVLHYPPQPTPTTPLKTSGQFCKASSKEKLRCGAVACLVTYVIGLFTFFPHLISIILSLRLVKKGFLSSSRKGWVVAFSVLELMAWTLCACLAWFYTSDCYTYSDASFFGSTESNCQTLYWGWVPIVIWFAITVVLGVPRVILSWQSQKPDHLTPDF